jgi:tRNA nucleotidyltransferase (CCA-adding enzyme)
MRGMSADADRLTLVLPAVVRSTLRRLLDAGHEAVLVGGSVRDPLLGIDRPPSEWDAATSATPDTVASLLPGAIWENRFGTVTVVGEPRVEITSYRTEGGYRDHRRPDEVRFGASLEEDLARRDFTINAVAWVPIDLDAGEGRLVDPFGGRADLHARVLRAVGDPRERFAEDALRLVRAARLAAQLHLVVEPRTATAVRELAGTAATVSAERVWAELERMLALEMPSRAFVALEDLGLLEVLLPELAALRGVPQAKRHPGDALDHTLAAVDAAPPGEDPPVRLAALLHDLGKASTLADGHFIGHERVGADLAAEVLRRLRVRGALADRVVHAVRHHMYAYDDNWTDAAVRRFIRRVAPEGRDLLFALRRADNLASGVGAAGEQNQAVLERRIADELERQPDLLLRNRLAIDGHDLVRELGIEPGPAIGRLLDVLTERVLDDPSLNRPDRLLALARDAIEQR